MTRRVQAISFAGGIVAFAILVARTGPAALLADLRSIGWNMAWVLVVWAGVYVLNSLAWHFTMLGEPDRPPFPRTFAISVSSFALNYVTPFVNLGGEPFKIAAASQWLGPRRALASALNFRLLHMQAHFLFFLTGVGFAFWLIPRGTVGTAALLAIAVVLVLASALLFALQRRGMLERLLDLLHRTPLLRRLGPTVERHRAALIEVDAALIAIHDRSPRLFYAALAAEYASRVLSMAEFYFIGRGIGVEISFWTAFLIGCFSSLVVNLFFFVPFSLGSKEGGLALIFHLLDLPTNLGLAAAIASRLRELAWIAIGLTLVLATRRRGAAAPAGHAEPTPSPADAAERSHATPPPPS